MIQAAAGILVALSLLAASPTSPSSAANTARMKHSGTVISIDAERGVMVLAEVGPWRVRNGEMVVTRRTIRLTPATKVDTFIRVNVPGQFAGDFLEVPLDAADVTPGDFVTVDCLHERGRLIALRVTMAELE